MERVSGFYGQNIEKDTSFEANLYSPQLAFVIPSFNHPVDAQIDQIGSLFSSYQRSVIVVNDGSFSPIIDTSNTNAILIMHSRNLGLARSLVDGYKKALETSADLIVRTDADGEYPISSVSEAIRLLEDSHTVGVFIEHRRSIKSSGLIDSGFHNAMGYIEGNLLIGQPMKQHSPGLQIYKREVVEKMIPTLEKYVLENNIRWGLDLITIRLASEMGKVVPVTLDSHIWQERRPIKKIISQLVGATKIMLDDKKGKIKL